MNVVELFPCSGGMAEGLRRASIAITEAFDYDADACRSYTKNMGHAPVRMDVRDLARMVKAGWRPSDRIDLFVADPPCTPWSRAGKRKGQADERDMIAETVNLVQMLKPVCFLIANVPGLDDGPNWHIVQKTIGSLATDGYCIDFARLDACNYGVPQHRVRPFWFGHPMRAPHLQWPEPTHADPKLLRTGTLAGVRELSPWVTCRQALGHLSGEDLGVPVRLRWRGQNGKQVASVPDAPARVVGTTNLSDGNVLAHPTEAVREGRRRRDREPGKKARASHIDAPADVVTTRQNGGGNGVFDGPDHRPSKWDDPARTLTKEYPLPRGARGARHGDGQASGARPGRSLDDRARRGEGHAAPDNRGHGPNAVKLSEKAAAILQGFPESWCFSGDTKKARWAQIGMAMPPPLAEAVGRSIKAWFDKRESRSREATAVLNGGT